MKNHLTSIGLWPATKDLLDLLKDSAYEPYTAVVDRIAKFYAEKHPDKKAIIKKAKKNER